MNKNLENGQNTGLITPKPAPLDFIAGVETGIPFEVRNDSKDWRKFYPSDEYQFRRGYFDSQSCVTFYQLNALETQIQYLLDTGKIPEDKRILMTNLGYFDDNGKVNFNESYTATLSGTTAKGNTFQAVADSMRAYGVIPQKKHHQIEDCVSIDDFLNRDLITPEMIALGKRFLDIFDVKYEWVVLGELNQQETIARHIQHAPLGFAVPTGLNWSDEGIIDNKSLSSNHAVMNGIVSMGSYFGILDNYEPFQKMLAWGYSIPYVFKLVVSVKTPPKPAPAHFTYKWTRDLKVGSTGYDVTMLQKGLAHLGFFKLGYFTEYFGEYTKNALIAFQQSERGNREILIPAGITDGKGTGNFKKFTMDWFNKYFS